MKLSANAIATAMGQAQVIEAVAAPVDTVTPALRLPKVGESVAILHRADLNQAGYTVIADAPLMPSEVVQVFEGSYPHQRVKVGSGDVWDVTLADSRGKGAVWMTVRIRYPHAL